MVCNISKDGYYEIDLFSPVKDHFSPVKAKAEVDELEVDAISTAPFVKTDGESILGLVHKFTAPRANNGGAIEAHSIQTQQQTHCDTSEEATEEVVAIQRARKSTYQLPSSRPQPGDVLCSMVGNAANRCKQILRRQKSSAKATERYNNLGEQKENQATEAPKEKYKGCVILPHDI